MYLCPYLSIFPIYFGLDKRRQHQYRNQTTSKESILPTALISEKQNTLTLNTDHFNFIGCFDLHDEYSLQENTPEKNCPVMD